MTDGDDTLLLLGAYRDGELSPGETLDMDRRLAADLVLRARLDRLGAFSGAVRDVLAAPPIPPALKARVIAQGRRHDRARRPWRQALQPLAAMLLVGLLGGGLIGSGVTVLGLGPRAGEAIADAVLAGHLRGLAAPSPFDVASSNRHVVKPWFNGRTMLAPEAPDLAAEGFGLAGGRIDIVGSKPVPTLVYGHDQHVISVTAVLRDASAPETELHRGGLTIERWSAGDLDYWAVSDLDPRELRGFVTLFRAQSGR